MFPLHLGNIPMIETEKAWLAGFVDGEGHIGIQKITAHNRTFFNVRMQITQCNYNVLQYVAQLTKHQRIHIAHRANKNQAQAWVWCSDMRVTVKILQEIIPYLRVKKPQAELALEFNAYWIAHRPKKKRRGQQAEPFDYSIFSPFKARMHALNARGKEKSARAG